MEQHKRNEFENLKWAQARCPEAITAEIVLSLITEKLIKIAYSDEISWFKPTEESIHNVSK